MVEIEKLDVEKVRVLTQPIVPVILHGLNPRNLMKSSEWDKLKKQYREKANHHCMICQRYVSHSRGDWLELHEVYEYDYENLIQKIVDFVSICKECHMFIHLGRTEALVSEGKITSAKFMDILNIGMFLLQSFDLLNEKNENLRKMQSVLHEKDWKLEWQGNTYRPADYPELLFNRSVLNY